MTEMPNITLSKTTGIIILLLMVLSLNISAQVTGVYVTPSAYNVGTTLIAHSTGSVPDTVNVIFSWYYSPSNTLITTSDSYSVQASDQGNSIYAVAEVRKKSDNSLVDSFTSTAQKVNSFPVASYVGVTGTLRVGMTLTGTYVYTDADNDPQNGTIFQWYRGSSPGGSGAVAIGTNSISYTLTLADTGKYIGFRVTPASLSGSTPGVPVTSALWIGKVTANSAPVVPPATVTISGSYNVNAVLTGHYTYSDAEGDVESGSHYEWLISTAYNGTYSPIPQDTLISHQIKMSEQAMYFKFSITPKAASGIRVGSKVVSSGYAGPANSAPFASGVYISGYARLDSTITGNYSFNDVDHDPQGTSLFQWFRGNIAIPGATSLKYKLIAADVDSIMTFKVTPVTSGTSYPNTGMPVTATIGPVTDPSAGNPVVTEICINGNRQAGDTLTGYYKYQDKYRESGSTYLWYRNDTLLSSGNSESDIKHIMTARDAGARIEFAVVPRNNRKVTGLTYKSATLPYITMTKLSYSEQDKPELLVATPPSGIFQGTGVVNGNFDPYIATSKFSPYTIEYLYNASKILACAQKAFISLTVNPVVTYIEGVKNVVFCDNSGVVTIHARKVPASTTGRTFTITDPAANLIQLNDTTATFEPDKMRTGYGVDTVYYSYTDGLSPIKIREMLVIDHIEGFSLTGISAGDSICDDRVPFKLFTSPSGGTHLLTGPVVADTLYPALVNPLGASSVTYKYTTVKGCSKTIIVPFTVNPHPDPDFDVTDLCIDNENELIRFTNNTDTARLQGPVSWLWNFSDSRSADPLFSNDRNPATTYKKGGYQKITLTAKTSKGCTDTKEKIVNFGWRPQARFNWLNECRKTNGELEIRDNSVAFSSPVTSRSWNFFDGDSLRTTKVVKYPQGKLDSLTVQLTVNTDFTGCNDVIKRTIYIKPTVKMADVAGQDTLFDFEKGTTGWVKDYNSVNKWVLGSPDRSRINRPYSGTHAWYTAYDPTKRDTAFYSVVSPCFDFTSIERPMISMMTWKRFDNNRNGATLQYQVGDSASWQYVGTLQDGIRWFNSALIGRPKGGNIVGWSTESPDTAWTDSEHQLDFLKGKKDVKFRIAYASDGTTDHTDGMAFDNVRIGERKRNLLLEHFENMNRKESSQATSIIDTLVSHFDEDVVNIQYHTNFPGIDSFYYDNPADVNARVLFYGLTRTPYSFIDGGYDVANFAGLYDYSLATDDEKDLINKAIIRRSLTSTPFHIDLTSNIWNKVLSVGGKITALEDINAENLTLYIAVLEKSNSDHSGYGGDKLCLNIFRKFMPNGGGLNLKKSWAKKDELTFPDMTWPVKGITDYSKIEVVAFLQNGITKNVYQSTLPQTPGNATGTGDAESAALTGFSVFPNPAVNKLTIYFSEPLKVKSEISVYDLQGRTVSFFTADQGMTEYIIPSLGLKPGIYLLRISQRGRSLGSAKLVIGN